jgi:two-component system, cell cycle response regulator CpdR
MAKILLAEDDAAMRQFLAGALERAGHEVTQAGDGLQALAAVEDADYDLLLADIVMPGMDGIALSERAGVLQPNLKVMFITGFAGMAAQAARTPRARARPAPVVAKPFHLRDLVGQVERVLAA